ncbi:EscE/YscE/SsaE family type III secretion system needle protein co-chaperone [Pseudomonas fluorescens]|uniref:EscE/YscE/SsaE family type III secretion system needle protein co-chaperone n=1 Tax=Pseudomonas fluorescens TaxID=294 RepID=A0A423LHK1_PSEFL|nr:EscE/YscE/SsaE family type III secretion system needle protein co-chaperone [Pseudomonas fluorescens]RON67793.1 EscE/YscE/SsaE family type III secretion system needle protein co-chaperone [Pseudomonas fluorescens]
MMTALEERLCAADVDFERQVRSQLEQAQAIGKRRLISGGEPRQYQQWQMEAEAVEAAIRILNTLKGAS